MMLGFIIWSLGACLFIGLGIRCLFAKEAVGFWANAKPFAVTDVKKYNKAMCKLWCAYGIIMFLLGIPLISIEQNSPIALISAMGVIAESFALMIVYVCIIEKKYRKK